MKNLIVIPLVLLALSLVGQPSEGENSYNRKTYNTSKITPEEAPIVDGILSDQIWGEVSWAEDFTVSQPNNGDRPMRQTKFKILYDEGHLYAAFKCYHEDPDNIESRLARRDNFPGDWVEINIDSYFDKNTAFSFTTSVSGVKGDEFITGNGNNWDTNWNPIWYAKTNIDEEGWTAEIKIPMSQLRFGNKDVHTWGFNVMRRDFGNDERSTWQHIPQNVSGWVSNFAEMHGISGIRPAKQLELQPFVVSSLRSFEKEEGNPFADGSDGNITFGLDGKVGVTSDLTLDFTINPDFGQVEADPSTLTLDGFQIFFGERRPFFVENANLFGFQVSRFEAGSPTGNDNLFYSRRIGSRPSGYFSVPEGAYSSRPDFTTILGAAKLSGKTKDGWSFSVLESVTAEESAEIDQSGERSEAIVEPLTNYSLMGLSKDFRNGGTRLSGTLTGVHRSLDDTGLKDQFHKEAITGGLDFFHSWKGREWQLKANYIFSNVNGTANKIYNTQTSFEHYYQRPDADHISVDETLTSLAGSGATFSIANYGGEDNISFQSGVTYRSPGIELNDIGFLNTADEIHHVSWLGYRAPNPFSIFRSFRVNTNHYQRWTSAGERLYHAVNANIHLSFKNYWSFRTGTDFEFKDISAKSLFGGPLLKRSPGFFSWINIESDERKSITYGLHAGGGKAIGKDDGAVDGYNINFGINAQPNDKLRISLNPGYAVMNRVIQNVGSFDFENDLRYLTARVRQETFSLSVRINYSITPDLTIQYWGQPFVSKGNYDQFKYITDPLGDAYTDRFQNYTDDQINYDLASDSYSIDDNLDGVIDHTLGNPDFNFLQFRSNLVMRWEYRPGSEFFLVWTQSTTNFGDPEKDLFTSLGDDLFGKSFNNIFLMKFTYRYFNK